MFLVFLERDHYAHACPRPGQRRARRRPEPDRLWRLGGRGRLAGKIAVTATDSACTVAQATLPAGTHTFTITNKGGKVTEFYVYGTGDRVLGEVENMRGLTGTCRSNCPPAPTRPPASRAWSATGSANP